MNAVPHHEISAPGQSFGPQRRREALSAVLDGEGHADDLNILLTAGSEEMTVLRSDGQAFDVIGDVLRGRAAHRSVDSEVFAASVMARLRNETPALPEAVVSRAVADRPLAANDAVFRWKLVAGLASLAAVVAVTWTVGVRDGGLAGPQMAAVSPTPQPVAAPQPLVVQTAQGQVLRDARLEQLLSEHRQFGGMSALQAPAGFLRNATYDASPQR